MNFRIAVLGSHSTGKTTLGKALARELNIPYLKGDLVQEIVKTVFLKNSPLVLTREEYWEMEQWHYHKQLEDATINQTFVSDGGFPLDAVYLGVTHNLRNNQSFKDFTKQCFRQTKKLYSHIIYLPPEISLVDDNFRPQDIQYQKDIDKFLVELLKTYKVPYFTVKGDVAQRVTQVLDGITNYQQK